MAKIIITKFHGFNPAFENLKPNTTHEVVDVKVNKIWVRGVDADVLLYPDEYKWVEEFLFKLPDGHTYQFVCDSSAPSLKCCMQCALKEQCDKEFIFPCWYKYRKDGLSGYFTRVDTEMTENRPA